MVTSWEGEGGECGTDAGIKKYKLVSTEWAGDVKNRMGNGVAKQLMAYGPKIRGGRLLEEMGATRWK